MSQEKTNAGDLDRRITIEAPTFSQDAAGGKTETWATFAVVWARYTPLRGAQYFAANQLNSQNNATFRIRYLAGVASDMRVNFDGQVWYIQSTNVEGVRKEYLDLLCRAHQAT